MSKQPTIKQVQREYKIDTVCQRTGCTRAAARAELIAEEWNTADAIINIKQAKEQGVL